MGVCGEEKHFAAQGIGELAAANRLCWAVVTGASGLGHPWKRFTCGKSGSRSSARSLLGLIPHTLANFNLTNTTNMSISMGLPFPNPSPRLLSTRFLSLPTFLPLPQISYSYVHNQTYVRYSSILARGPFSGIMPPLVICQGILS